jgi:hypothetical protein
MSKILLSILFLLVLAPPAWAQRDFNGTNEKIDFGSDASIDDFTSFTIAFWLRVDTADGVWDVLGNKRSGNTSGWDVVVETFSTPDKLRLNTGWSGTAAEAAGHSVDITTGVLVHVAITYDTSSASNDPIFYVDGVANAAPTENVAPSGTYGADAANNLVLGEDASGGSDFDGVISCFAYDNTIWTAAQVNRHRWHCRPGGAVKVLQTFYGGKLANEGTATANGTATGTTVVSLPRGTRPGAGIW